MRSYVFLVTGLLFAGIVGTDFFTGGDIVQFQSNLSGGRVVELNKSCIASGQKVGEFHDNLK